MALTNFEVKNAKPRGDHYKLTDAQGLHLFVSRAGGKTWRFKYRYGSKEKLLTLGRYPAMGLLEARQAANNARGLLAAGKDPITEAHRERQARIDASEATFKKIAEEWFEDQSPLWSKANATRVRHRLVRDLYPAFGKLPIGSIESPTILTALRKIEARGSIETAKRVRGYVRSIFKRAKGERLVPAAMIIEIDELSDALKPARPGRQQPALTTLEELLALQRAVDVSTSSLIVKLASRLLALTVVRVGVLREATWSEFHGIDWGDPDKPCEKPIWRIRAERMKLEVADKMNAAFAHEVLLSTQAVAILRVLRAITGSSPYVFPNAKGWRLPMTDAALSTLYKRLEGGIYKGRMVPHGWRSAFSTLMNERAAELERDGDRMIIDMILAHVPPGMSASEWAYNRARYVKPRASLYQVWADLISEGLPEPSSFLADWDR